MLGEASVLQCMPAMRDMIVFLMALYVCIVSRAVRCQKLSVLVYSPHSITVLL